MGALFAQARGQRLAWRIKCAARVWEGTLKEDRHEGRRTASQRMTDNHQLRRSCDLHYMCVCRPTLASSASSTRKSVFSTCFFSKSIGSSCRRVRSLITSFATKYIPCRSLLSSAPTRWVYSPSPLKPNSLPASSSDWVSIIQIVGIPIPARMSVTTSFIDHVPRMLITMLSYLES